MVVLHISLLHNKYLAKEKKMALTEETVEDKIEIVGDFKMIQVRTATVIKKDGAEITRSFHRHVVAPNISADDLAKESADVQALAKQFHTTSLKADYEKHLEDNKAGE